MYEATFQSWSLEKIHDKLIHIGRNDLAQHLRSTAVGLNWHTPAQQICQLNGILAGAYHALLPVQLSPRPIPPDGSMGGGQAPVYPARGDWENLERERRAA